MPVHIAAQGDSVHSIAFARGLHPQTIWDHAQNQHLAEGKRSLAVLMPGDELFVPDLVPREESAATQQRHRFRRKAIPQRFKVRFFRFGHPRKDEPFTSTLDGAHGPSGRLDGQGQLDIPVSPAVARIRITLGEDAQQEVFEFNAGHLDPSEERSGILARLASLGHHVDENALDPDAELRAAVKAFQAEQELNPTGELDQPTLDRLRDLYEWNADPLARGDADQDSSSSNAGRA
jgi:hypothetical protein